MTDPDNITEARWAEAMAGINVIDTEVELDPVFTYNQLSEKAKERACEWYQQYVFSESCDWEFVYEYVAEIGAALGIEIGTTTEKRGDRSFTHLQIYFSGFCSQGDGASFEGWFKGTHIAPAALEMFGNDETLLNLAERLAVFHIQHGALRADITTRTNRNHSTVVALHEDYEVVPPTEVFETQEKDLQDIVNDFCDWIYAQLEAEYEYQSSDEVVADNLQNNGYEFTESGDRV